MYRSYIETARLGRANVQITQHFRKFVPCPRTSPNMRQHNIYIFIAHTIYTCVSNIMLYFYLYCTCRRAFRIFYYFYDFFSFDDDARICKIRGRALNNIRVYSRQDAFAERYKVYMSDVCFIVTSVRHAMCSYIESDPL